MKKLMMMMAVVCAASFVGAAQLTWRQNTTAFTVDGIAANGNAVVLVACDAGAAAPTLSWSDGKLSVSGGEIYGVANLGSGGILSATVGTITGESGWAGGKMTQIGGTAEITTSYTAKDYYEFIFDSGTITEGSKYQQSAVMTSKLAGKATGTLTLAFGGAALSSENWTNIPEPCTVALLALGMGALALRRKQR